MALFGVPIVIPSVFGILWRRPNTKGVYLCIAMGVVSGILLKTCWKGLSWEAGTFVQVGCASSGSLAARFSVRRNAKKNRGKDCSRRLI